MSESEKQVEKFISNVLFSLEKNKNIKYKSIFSTTKKTGVSVKDLVVRILNLFDD